MAWTYNLDALNEPLNQLRLAIGDTNSADQQLQDEELERLLVLAGDSVDGAALMAARVLQAKYARSVDKWVGDLKILASQRARAYGNLVEQLETQGLGLGVPSAGGIRIADKEAIQEDSDLVVPSFRRGLFENTEE